MVLDIETANRSTGRLNKRLDPTQTGSEAAKLSRDLRQNIVGQDEAIEQVVSMYQTYLAGMISPGRPVGNFLFLGPTGSGKTRLVEALAESLAGDMRAVIKIDCAEFQHSHEIAKLIGSPPGYLGHRETHPLLSQEVLNQYHTEKLRLSFVLFDEIEKASDSLWNLLLGILDKATLTLGDNRRVDFSQAMVFMTSNLGALEMSSILRPNIGFGSVELERKLSAGSIDDNIANRMKRAGIAAARRKFTPEFMNRIDKTVVFRPLGETELREILSLELNRLQKRILSAPNGVPFVFSLTDAAKEHILGEGTDAKYGARHLKRAIDRSLVHLLSNLVASGQIRSGDFIRVDYDEMLNRMTFVKEAEELPERILASIVDTSFDPPPTWQSASASVEPIRAAGVRRLSR